MDLEILDSKYLLAVGTGLGSIIITILTQHLLNRRARFRYFATHWRVGLSTDDEIFGSLRMTWNGNVVANLFSSTVELVNESMRDFENIVVRVFTSDATLLTQRTEIVGTSHILYWTADYSQRLSVPAGQHPTPEQYDLIGRQRDFVIPTMNRGQAVRLTFLNAAKGQSQPTLWLDVLHKGVKLEFGAAQNQILGVPQPKAALVGSLFGIVMLVVIIVFVHSVWLAAIIAILYGLFAQVSGAYAVRIARWIQNIFGG